MYITATAQKLRELFKKREEEYSIELSDLSKPINWPKWCSSFRALAGMMSRQIEILEEQVKDEQSITLSSTEEDSER